jgi:hypothetical protein
VALDNTAERIAGVSHRGEPEATVYVVAEAEPAKAVEVLLRRELTQYGTIVATAGLKPH